MHVTSEETPGFVKQIYGARFPGASTEFLDNILDHTIALFNGEIAGFQASDTAYHDLSHTLEATVALVRILDGHLANGATPQLTERDFSLAVAAMLLHDSGFIKETGDDDGTGAKYTLEHVLRSEDYAARFLPSFGVKPEEIRLVQLAIGCTGVNVVMERLPFRDEKEYFLGCALGSADLLGQMAAPGYPERIPGLYQEFAEATDFTGDYNSWIATYKSVEQLMSKTRDFFQGYTMRMLEKEWKGVYRALEHHFPDGKNHYFDAILSNVDRIEDLLPGTAAKQ